MRHHLCMNYTLRKENQAKLQNIGGDKKTAINLNGLGAALPSLGGATTLGVFAITNGLALLAVFGSVVGVLGSAAFVFLYRLRH